jgi:hypothetical protein
LHYRKIEVGFAMRRPKHIAERDEDTPRTFETNKIAHFHVHNFWAKKYVLFVASTRNAEAR